MKKSSFVAMVLGTVSGVLFSLGMCMALLEEWNAFTEGVIFGVCGTVLTMVTAIPLPSWQECRVLIPLLPPTKRQKSWLPFIKSSLHK